MKTKMAHPGWRSCLQWLMALQSVVSSMADGTAMQQRWAPPAKLLMITFVGRRRIFCCERNFLIVGAKNNKPLTSDSNQQKRPPWWGRLFQCPLWYLFVLMKTVTESLFLCELTGHKINVYSIVAATKIKRFSINMFCSSTTFSLLDCTESYFQSRLSISHSGRIFWQCDQVRGKQPSFVRSATQHTIS